VNVFPGARSADNPESNSFPLLGSLGPVPDVTVWATLSLLVHVTLLPTLTLMGFGENDLSAKVEAPETIQTFLPLVELVTAEAVVIFAALLLMSLSEGGVRSSFGSVITG